MPEAPESSLRYRFVTGHGDQRQLDEINAMADAGYRVIHMIYNEVGGFDNKQVVILMENKNVHQEFAQEYSRG